MSVATAGEASSSAVRFVRWVLVVPAAVGVAVLILVGLNAIDGHWFGFRHALPFNLLAFVLLGVCCVLVPARVAPSRHGLVAWVAVGVYTVALLGAALFAGLSSDVDLAVSGGWTAVCVVAGIAAAFATCFAIGGGRGK